MSFSPEEYGRIRIIFLDRSAWYTVEEAARLVAMTPEWFEQCRIEPEHGSRVAWREVAHQAMEKYSIRYIEDALGDEASRVLPPLLRTADVVLRLPQAYVLRFSEVARHKGWMLDDLVAWYMAGEMGSPDTYAAMEHDHRGLVEALTFPTWPNDAPDNSE